MTDKFLNLLGLCRKANKLECGIKPVKYSVKSRCAKVVIIASDVSDIAISGVVNAALDATIKVITTGYTKVELGGAIGFASMAAAAVTDEGLAKAICKLDNESKM